jgi:hypothetical protein
MAIKIDVIDRDAQGLPVVSWIEDRNHFAPGTGGRERVSCFIRPDQETGELHFVAVGKVRHGEDIETRPWRKLNGFSTMPADIYRTAQEQVIVKTLGDKYKAAGVALTDGALVAVAHFEGPEGFDAPLHLNCAAASAADAGKLHAILQREFTGQQRAAVLNKAECRGKYVWPEGVAFVPYAPARLDPPPAWVEPLANLAVVAFFGLLGFGVWWFLLR